MLKTRIVLAEDNTEMLRYVREYLSTNDCEIVAAVRDGMAAIEAVAKWRPEIVVIDVSISKGHGIHAAAKLREAGLPTKVIFLTVTEDPDICRAALEAGASAYVLKSRMASDLMPAIKLVLDGGRFISPGCE